MMSRVGPASCHCLNREHGFGGLLKRGNVWRASAGSKGLCPSPGQGAALRVLVPPLRAPSKKVSDFLVPCPALPPPRPRGPRGLCRHNPVRKEPQRVSETGWRGVHERRNRMRVEEEGEYEKLSASRRRRMASAATEVSVPSKVFLVVTTTYTVPYTKPGPSRWILGDFDNYRSKWLNKIRTCVNLRTKRSEVRILSGAPEFLIVSAPYSLVCFLHRFSYRRSTLSLSRANLGHF
jgi:hypothetical protein